MTAPNGIMRREKHMTVELVEDVATGDLLCPIPESILSEYGWYEGTKLEWVIEGDELLLRELD